MALASVTRLRRLHAVDAMIRSYRPDVVLASGMRMVWATALLARRSTFSWIAVGHGREFGSHALTDRVMNWWAFRHANAVVCVSHFTWRVMTEAGIRPSNGHVIHNGADPELFRLLPVSEIARFRAELGLGDSRIIATVGNVTPRKGQDVVIRALPRILEQVSDVHYVAMGLPTHVDHFSRIAHQLGVAERVHFLGRTGSSTLIGILNAADVFAMTSRHTPNGDFEGYGIAVIEAGLCGKPAVVSLDSGLAETIVEGVTGLGVREDDPEDTARALIDLLCNDDRRQRMAGAARAYALQHTWEHTVAEYEEVLGLVIDQSRSARARRSGRLKYSRRTRELEKE
jgi:phosphatidylinositol alpha-1,6-mannosyltransferase